MTVLRDSKKIRHPGWKFLRSGKVRDTFATKQDGLLAMVSTDRISIFDVVLPIPIPGKGETLAKLTHLWCDQTGHIIPNHFWKLLGPGEVPHPVFAYRTMAVWEAVPIKLEAVVRHYLTGSAWAEYRWAGTVNGKPLPSGLLDGSKLPEPLFTPTTKATEGHDLPVGEEEAALVISRENGLPLDFSREIVAFIQEKSFALMAHASSYAERRGIIIADTKFEFGLNKGSGSTRGLILIDEVLTPDSSRFWDAALWKPGQSQPSFDKQYVRDYGERIGWDKNSPGPRLPKEIVEGTTRRYQECLERLTTHLML